jgi:hypothetical protein
MSHKFSSYFKQYFTLPADGTDGSSSCFHNVILKDTFAKF